MFLEKICGCRAGKKKKKDSNTFTQCRKHIQPGMGTLSQRHSEWENSLVLKVFGPILSEQGNLKLVSLQNLLPGECQS